MEPDFPCLADKIAKPRPDMIIKVAAFTVSEKSIIMYLHPTEFAISSKRIYLLQNLHLYSTSTAFGSKKMHLHSTEFTYEIYLCRK